MLLNILDRRRQTSTNKEGLPEQLGVLLVGEHPEGFRCNITGVLSEAEHLVVVVVVEFLRCNIISDGAPLDGRFGVVLFALGGSTTGVIYTGEIG
jgi:hypothetical protein